LSHEQALKWIGRYLKATRDKGLILSPSGKLKVDAYPDADFAGLYGYELNTDPACAKSRTGFLITVSDCPMVWISKLQTETALSTMEAEINALAHCCRELFPVIDIVEEIGKTMGLETKDMILSGRYLISAINHTITRENHICNMELIKNSILTDLTKY
jgi:hypothetical protein